MKRFIAISKEVRSCVFKHPRMLNYLVRKELMRHFIANNTANTYLTDDL